MISPNSISFVAVCPNLFGKSLKSDLSFIGSNEIILFLAKASTPAVHPLWIIISLFSIQSE